MSRLSPIRLGHEIFRALSMDRLSYSATTARRFWSRHSGITQSSWQYGREIWNRAMVSKPARVADHRCATQLLVLNQYGGVLLTIRHRSCMHVPIPLHCINLRYSRPFYHRVYHQQCLARLRCDFPSSYPNPLETQTSPSDSQNHRLPRSS